MDTVNKKQLEEMENRLENVIDIIMEHFKETDERISELEETIEELQNAIETTIA